MSSAVQFYGTEEVYQAAANRKIPAWGIWQMRMFLFKYEGNNLDESLQLLHQTLEILENSQSTATYTIKFFEQEGTKPVKIKENSQCDGGSFNFKMQGEEARQQRQMIYQGASTKVMETLERINARLDAIENGEDDDETEEEAPADIHSAIMGYVSNPDKLQQLLHVVNGVKALLFPSAQQPAYVGQINRMGQNNAAPGDPAPGTGGELSQPGTKIELSESSLIRVGNAIEVLQVHDAKIVEHLEKLAKLAEGNPAQFSQLLTMLDFLP